LRDFSDGPGANARLRVAAIQARLRRQKPAMLPGETLLRSRWAALSAQLAVRRRAMPQSERVAASVKLRCNERLVEERHNFHGACPLAAYCASSNGTQHQSLMGFLRLFAAGFTNGRCGPFTPKWPPWDLGITARSSPLRSHLIGSQLVATALISGPDFTRFAVQPSHPAQPSLVIDNLEQTPLEAPVPED